MPLNKISQEQQAVFDGTEGLEDGDMLSYNAVAGDWENKSQDELDIAPQTSPSFTGAPSAPTQAPGNNTTLIATTEFVTEAVESAGYIPSTEKAVANGVATLDGAGIVPSSQLPTYLADTLTVAEPLTAHGSMFEPDASNDLTTPATVANQFTVKAGQYRVNGTLIDLPATVVTLPAAPATSALLSRKDLVYLQEDGSIGVYEGTNDNPTMADAGFSAVSGEAGLWVNGGTYATPLVSVQRRNQGAYHPAFNENGCGTWWDNAGLVSANRDWYSDRAKQPFGIADCFDFGTSSTIGNVSPFVYPDVGSLGSAGAGDGRPDSKFYDAIYLSDITDLRLQAKAPSATQLEPNYWQNKAVANELRHFVTEGIPRTVVKERGVVETSPTSSTAKSVQTGDSSLYAVGDFVVVLNQSGEHTASGYVRYSGSGKLFFSCTLSAAIDDIPISFLRTNGDIYTILKVEYTEATGADNTWTDVIGDPANYPRQWTGVIDYNSSDISFIRMVGKVVHVDELTTGSGTVGNVYMWLSSDSNTSDARESDYTSTSVWLDLGPKAEFLANATGFEGFPLLYGENGEDLIPDGSLKSFKMARKVSASTPLLQVASDDKGTSWSTPSVSADWDSTGNKYDKTHAATRLQLVSYQTPAHIFADDVNSEVLGGKIGVAWGSNQNGVSFGSSLVADLIDKVPTGNTGIHTRNKIVEDYAVPSSGSIATATNLAPAHSAYDLDDSGHNSAKALPYLHTDNNQAQLNVLFKEMIYDVTWGDDNTFTVTDNTTTDTDDNANTILVGTKSTKLPLVTGE